jgi:hypothetical protein
MRLVLRGDDAHERPPALAARRAAGPGPPGGTGARRHPAARCAAATRDRPSRHRTAAAHHGDVVELLSRGGAA